MTNEWMEEVLRVVLAGAAGVVIGYDRERSGKAAGVRTQMLVCVGSALLAIISVQLAAGRSTADPARLVAQVVSGIGFLGAGVILKNGNRVVGVTTAATIWITAAVGIALGTGYYGLAILTVVMIMLINPIARFQYKYGLKGSFYFLRVGRRHSAVAKKTIDFLRLQERGREVKNSHVVYKILSSRQRNEMLAELLERNRVAYKLEEAEE